MCGCVLVCLFLYFQHFNFSSVNFIAWIPRNFQCCDFIFFEGRRLFKEYTDSVRQLTVL